MNPRLTLLLLLCGCVTQQTFDTLKSERDGLQATVEERNQALRDAEAKQKKTDTQVKELHAQLASEQDRARDLGARLERASAEMAAATKDKSRLQASVEDMTRALSELEKRRAEAEARVQEFKSLLSRFRALIDAGKLKVKLVEGRMVVVLATDILFASGSAALSKEGRVAVGEVSGVLSSIPRRAFQVEGHTDNVPIASAQYPSNWELASARAITVVKAMIDADMPPERVSAASYGETRPVALNEPATRAQNRRIEITIIPDLSTLPGFEELKKVEAER